MVFSCDGTEMNVCSGMLKLETVNGLEMTSCCYYYRSFKLWILLKNYDKYYKISL